MISTTDLSIFTGGDVYSTNLPLEDLAGNADEDRNRMVSDTILSAVYCVIGMFGFLGNLLVVFVIVSSTMKKEVTNMYICSQSMIDSMVAAMIILQTLFQDNGKTLTDSFGDVFVCRVWYTKFPMWMIIECSSWNLVALTFERYMAIVHPIKHKLFYTKKKVIVSVTIIFCASCIVQGSYKVWSSGIEDGICKSLAFWPSKTGQRLASLFIVLYNFLCPLICITILYISMYRSLRTRVRPADKMKTASEAVDTGAPRTTEAERSNAKMERALRNLLTTLSIVVLCFFLCWICNQVYFFLFNLGYQIASFHSPFYHISVVAVFFNCCCNPVIYMIKYKKFQVGMNQMFRKLARRVGVAGMDAHFSTSSNSGVTHT